MKIYIIVLKEKLSHGLRFNKKQVGKNVGKEVKKRKQAKTSVYFLLNKILRYNISYCFK